MKYLLASSLILFLAACASPTKKPHTLSAELTNLANPHSLACQFEKKLVTEKNSQSSKWYFWRQARRTETRDALTKQGEIWERNNAGQFFYTRLFYNERVAVEFMPGDLKATGASASWQQLSSIVDPNTLGKELALTGKENLDKMTVEYYRGTLNGIDTEVDWLPALQLPARIAKKQPDGIFQLSLSGCDELSKAAMQPISKVELDEFRHLDYADMGDMELDPVVQHIEQLMGGHHHDGH